MNQPPFAARAPLPRKPKWRSKGWWLRQLHSWHYMSAAVSLAAMLMFAVTGFTLNHAQSIGATPVTVSKEGRLAPPLLATLRPAPAAKDAALPGPVAAAVKDAVGLDPAARPGEWSDGEVYVALTRPGGDGWVSIDRTSGRITSETTSRGLLAVLNDLHKGRNSGPAWGWLIDIFAGACIIFSVTGLFLLKFLAKNRPATWPLVGLGIFVPVCTALFLIH